jgi:hypothetical protein
MDPNYLNYPHDDNNAMGTMGEDAYNVMGMGTDLSTGIDDNEMKKSGGFLYHRPVRLERKQNMR